MRDNLPMTAGYKVVVGETGNRYRFFCALSGAAVCTTKPVNAETQEKELLLAWNTEGRGYFSRCGRCGKWVSDVMYNPDMLECVDCAPWENPPHYCGQCGSKVTGKDMFCRKCGAKLQYREVMKDDC